MRKPFLYLPDETIDFLESIQKNYPDFKRNPLMKNTACFGNRPTERGIKVIRAIEKASGCDLIV